MSECSGRTGPRRSGRKCGVGCALRMLQGLSRLRLSGEELCASVARHSSGCLIACTPHWLGRHMLMQGYASTGFALREVQRVFVPGARPARSCLEAWAGVQVILALAACNWKIVDLQPAKSVAAIILAQRANHPPHLPAASQDKAHRRVTTALYQPTHGHPYMRLMQKPLCIAGSLLQQWHPR